MTCSEARERLLVADLADLDPGRTSALAAHVGECVSCTAVAASIVGETALLRLRVRRRRSTARRHRLVMLGAVPVAAAIVAVFVQARASAQRGIVQNSAPASFTHSVGVDVAPGQQATVIRTADPKVTVIWLTPGVGE